VDLFGGGSIWNIGVMDEDFEFYYEDFERIVHVVEKVRDESKQLYNLCVNEGYDEESQNYYLNYNGKKFVLNEQEQKSLKNVQKAFKFKDAKFDYFRVFETKIKFETNNGQYELVYSSDDSEPTYMGLPEKEKEFKCKRIRKNWYHVVKIPD